MMKTQLLITGLLVAGTLATNAQNTYVKQYFNTSGGSYGTPKNKVKVYTIADAKVKPIDSVYGDFSNFVNIYNDKTAKMYIGTAHIGRGSGDDLLVRYDLDTYDRLDSLVTSGAQAVAQNETKLIVAKGFGAKGTNLEIFNAKTLQLIKEFREINPASDVKIWGDSAFISHSLKSKVNTCGPKYQCYADSIGYLSIVKLSDNSLVSTISLGQSGAGIKGLNLYKGQDQRIHVIYNNTKDTTDQVVGNLVLHAIKKTIVLEAKGPSIYGIRATSPYLTAVKINKATNDTTKANAYKSPGFDGDNYGYDTVNNVYLILRTDYFSYGKFLRYDVAKAKAIDSVSVGISETRFAIDYRPSITTNITHTSGDAFTGVYPNPFRDFITVNSDDNTANWEILNLQGQKLMNGNTEVSEGKINTENLIKGVYYLVVNSGGTQRTVKIVKE